MRPLAGGLAGLAAGTVSARRVAAGLVPLGRVASCPRPAEAGSWLSARVDADPDSAACVSWPLPTLRLRSGPDTTNSTTARPASAIPDQTRGENAKPLAKSPIATPIFQNISIEPVR